MVIITKVLNYLSLLEKDIKFEPYDGKKCYHNSEKSIPKLEMLD